MKADKPGFREAKFGINTDSCDTVNNRDDATVPGTAGYPDQITRALAANDSMAAGNLIKIDIQRAVAAAAGDLEIVGVVFEYTKQ